jgi:hypothetical protein
MASLSGDLSIIMFCVQFHLSNISPSIKRMWCCRKSCTGPNFIDCLAHRVARSARPPNIFIFRMANGWILTKWSKLRGLFVENKYFFSVSKGHRGALATSYARIFIKDIKYYFLITPRRISIHVVIFHIFYKWHYEFVVMLIIFISIFCIACFDVSRMLIMAL